MHIGFLACPETMPSAGTRRGDAFEHDLQMAALRPAIEGRRGTLTEIEWRSPLDAFAGIDLVLLGTAWDYQDHAAEFLAALETLEEAGIAVCNPSSLVRWNMDKRYLLDLESKGARIIPTVWANNPGLADIEQALDRFGCETIVVKRQVGAGGLGQHLFSRGSMPAGDWTMGRAAMIQPFLPSIKDEGELSFVFIDGRFSHAIRKTAAGGEYRIQSLYGGKETKFTPQPEDISQAASVVAAMPGGAPLYARIDLIRDVAGHLMVMEAEAIEPFLYPVQGPELGEAIASAIASRL
ncbi:ATP-grasp domain-containing protein [Pontixanthobacter luteolus]|uniref:ATP-grasp domain-containing protein n=1 Tax=Pontixanthobacter luteolus TaxID=295089 RepID=UPI0019290F47|nr:hypothetical protein [Pontixanthobacter luteolus]